MKFKQKTPGVKIPKKPALAPREPMAEKIDPAKLEKCRMLLSAGQNAEAAVSLHSSPEDFEIVGAFLKDPNAAIRKEAVRTLGIAAKIGTDISAVLPAIATALSDTDDDVRSGATLALGNAAANRADIRLALPALANALSDTDVNVRWNAAFVLGIAAEKGTDIGIAIHVLAQAISDPNDQVRRSSAYALVRAANNLDHDTRVSLTATILGFVNSPAFRLEAEQNSTKFLDVMGYLGHLIWKIQEAEENAA